jgi:transposase
LTVHLLMPVDTGSGTMPRMLGMRDLPPMDLQALPAEAAAMITQLQQFLRLGEFAVALREAKIEKITFELARLKRWKFAAKSEAMNAEQRRLFEETLAEDEASLREQLERLRREAAAAEGTNNKPKAPPRRPRREALPAHLRRVEHRHEPESTDCQETGCGRPMTRIG